MRIERFSSGARRIASALTAVCILASFILTSGAGPALAQEAVDDSDVMTFKDGHAAMSAAIDRARETLGRLFELGEAGAPCLYQIKAPVPVNVENRAREHIWVNLTGVDGDDFVGTLANEPKDIPDKKFGDPISWPIAEISDWAVTCSEGDGVVMYGGYTSRVLKEAMSAEDQARYFDGLEFRD